MPAVRVEMVMEVDLDRQSEVDALVSAVRDQLRPEQWAALVAVSLAVARSQCRGAVVLPEVAQFEQALREADLHPHQSGG